MEFLKSGIKTVLGTVEPGQQPTAAETVEKLVDRVTSSSLLEDRRDACRALKALSRKFRVEVGAQGMSAMVQVLQNDCQDAEIISYALETLCNVTMTMDFEEEEDEDSNAAVHVQTQSNVGEQFTEIFIKDQENVNSVMNYLEEYDFRVRRSAIQLLTTLIANKTRDLQEIILVSPMGVSKLMDLLSDTREVVRNDAILLLIQLTKGNSNIQKIVAFENAFDKIFEIIREEGYSDGGIVVEDCLILLLNLLKNNTSNQQFFKEGSYIQKLSPMFVFSSEADEKQWTPQKVSNVHCMLQVVRALVTPSNQQQQVVSACQKVMRKSNLFQALCDILMSSGVPPDILTETINAVAEVMRGDNDNQDDLNHFMAPSTPPRPALVVLLMSMINEKQILSLRCAILYCFQCYLYRNENAQKAVIKTLLPSSETDVSSLSIGQLLCTGIFSTVDTLANWFSSIALMHCLIENSTQKEELLRVLLASPGGHRPITLLEQCSNLLQLDRNYKLQSKVGLLMMLSVWLSHCPTAVRTLLKTQGIMAYLTAHITSNEHDENEYLVQGMCAFLMGLCIQFNDNSLEGQTREDICQLVIKRIGQETFCNKLNEVSRHEAYSRACKQPQIRANSAGELLLDFEYCKLFKGLEALVAKIISGFNADNIELTELTLSSEASALVSQYKGIIRGLDSQINKLQESLSHMESQNTKLEQQLAHLQQSNSMLTDQNTLFKAQLSASQNSTSTSSTASGNEVTAEALNAAQFQTNLYYVDNLRLKKEAELLQERLSLETARANSVSDEFQKHKADQENLLELLTHQEQQIKEYKMQLTAAGVNVADDEDDETNDTAQQQHLPINGNELPTEVSSSSCNTSPEKLPTS